MGGVVDFVFGGGSSTTKTYQRLGELQRQTAKEAEPRPIVWGRVRPISGNIIHASAVTREMVEVGRTTTGGKGGGGKQTQVQYQERAYRTYAIRICEGPITGIVRVWKNDKLVYDARGNEWGDKNNDAFLKYAKFYLGEWDQMPDPALEAIWGAGNVPAYRGTCYMRVDNEDVTDFGGRVPAYTFEVQRAVYPTTEVYLTSEVYELPPPEPVVYDTSVDPEPIGVVASLVSGVFRSARQELEVEPEKMGITATLIEGSFSAPKVELSVEPESMAVEATFVEGSLDQHPVYRAPALSVSISMNIVGGSHE